VRPPRCVAPVVPVLFLLWSLATALPASATDELSPATVTVTLAPGESKTVTKHLHLDARPAKADIMLAIDTTSSMCTAITAAKNEATAIVNQVQADIPGAHFAVADFKDYPGFDPDDYPYVLRSALTPTPSRSRERSTRSAPATGAVTARRPTTGRSWRR
jgi:hypothetical protein